MNQYDVVIIGAGPAGLSAAIKAEEQGASTLVIERESHLGGILHQCIHPGFGLRDFGKELTGPEYAHNLIQQVKKRNIEVWTGTMVLQFQALPKLCLQVAKKSGVEHIFAKSVVLSMGCREKTRGNICIPGSRPAGIFTAGTAQRWINVEGFAVGQRAVILGSGDIGLIMARRLTLEGAKVRAVVELMPYETGLKRNVVQCLDDFNIPLLLGHTITEIHGSDRVEGVTVCAVDENFKPLFHTAKLWDCDCLLLSVGLIPENELTSDLGISIDPLTGGPYVNQYYMTDLPGVFACGNVLHVNDLVDNVSLEGSKAGENAASFPTISTPERTIEIKPGTAVRYTVPQRLDLPLKADTMISFRVNKPLSTAKVEVLNNGRVVYQYRIKRRVLPGELQSFSLPAKTVFGRGNMVVSVKEGVKDED